MRCGAANVKYGTSHLQEGRGAEDVVGVSTADDTVYTKIIGDIGVGCWGMRE